jgi:hypothetical protein
MNALDSKALAHAPFHHSGATARDSHPLPLYFPLTLNLLRARNTRTLFY